ncbi:MAG TPA: phospholipid scramblase-related protein [Trebonia sp.]|nr:phospholipid scramblase-related protein [Trebonia sp.]
MDGLFDFPELFIRQPGKLLAGRVSYEIFDARRRRLATATETEGRSRLQSIAGLVSGAWMLAVRTAAGEPVLTLAKRGGEWVTDLADPGGALIGRIRIEASRRQYTLLDERDQVAGEAAGNLAVNDFSVTGPGRERYARVRKTWAGLRKELLTSSDHYTVTFTGPVSPRVRTLIVMLPIVLDLARHEA